MPIRMTGMVSGLDTEAIINSLVEAQKAKNKKTTDKKTKLEWTQEKWKDLNTKIYSLYTGTLSKMRLQSSYGTKKVTCSNSDKVQVKGNSTAPLGEQSLTISKVAKSGYMTGAQITTESGGAVTSSTKMSELGIEDGTTLTIKAGSESKEITLNSDTKVSDLVKEMKEVGVNVNFDANQKRFYISAKKSGVDNDFALTVSDSKGTEALKKLGLVSDSLSAEEKAAYKPWADAANAATDDDIFANIMNDDTLKAYYKSQVSKRTESYQKIVTTLESDITTLNSEKDNLQTELDALNAINLDDADAYEEFQKKHASEMAAVEEEYNALPPDEQAATTLDEMKRTKADQLLAQDIANKTTEIQEKQDAIDGKQGEIDDINNTKLTGTDGNEGVAEEIKQEVIKKAKLSKDILDAGTVAGSGYTGKLATKIDGEDAEFVLNNVKYTSSTNETTINGVTLTLTGTTAPDETITFTVTNDTEGVYNMVKDFVKQYNEVLAEMNKLYYADSARGYDPLSDDERDAMSDTEIEKWETKIKDSLLRRDSTLGSLTSAMRSSLLTSVEVKGKKYSLSSFGICTSSDYSEKGKLHIKGDSEDDTYASETNKLKDALEKDPDTVMEVMTGIMGELYGTLQEKMKKTKNMSSALTFYNDIYMKNQITALNKQIKKDEEKLTDLEDRYYKQFTAMEKALSEMQSQTSMFSSYFGS